MCSTTASIDLPLFQTNGEKQFSLVLDRGKECMEENQEVWKEIMFQAGLQKFAVLSLTFRIG